MTTTTAKVLITAEDRSAAAFSAVRRNLDAVGIGMDTLKASALGALGALAAPVSVAGLTAIFNESRRAIDGLNDLADATGMGVEAASALDHVSRATGGSLESLTGIMVKFQSVIADADPSKGVGQVLKAINIDVAELRRMSPDEAIRKVAIATEELGSNADKTRVYQELFGKSIRDAAPFMKDLAEAKRLDAKLTAEQIEQVDRYNKEMSRLSAEAGNVARSLTSTVATALNQVIDRFKEGQKEGRSFWQIAMGGYAKDVGDIYGGAGPDRSRQTSGGMVRDMEDPAGPLRRWERANDKRPLASILPPAQADKKQATARADSRFSGLTYDEQITRRVGSLLEGSAVIKAKEYLDTLNQLDRLYFSGAINGDLYASAVEKLAGATARAGKVNEESLDLLAEEARVKQEMALLNDMLAGTESARLQKQRDEMAKALEWLEKGLVTEAEYVEMVSARLGLVAQSTTEAVDQAKRLGDAFANTFDSAFRGGMKLGDLLKKLAFDAINIQFLTPAAQQAGTWLGGMVSNAFKPGGLLSFAGGGYTGNGGRGGGLDGQGGFLAMLHPRETVVDHTTGGGAGGGVALTQHITIDARGADAGVESRIRAAMAQTKAETLALVQSRANRGGSFAAALGRA